VVVERLDGWLVELGMEPVERAEREGIISRDLILDGRRRQDIRMTLIVDESVGLICWVHYAPPLNDSFRVSYRRFLRWNDEFPFAKFALSEDERPVLISEVPIERLDRDALGSAVARLLALCDLLLDDSVRWLWPGADKAPEPARPSRQATLFARYPAAIAELSPALPELHSADARAGAAR